MRGKEFKKMLLLYELSQDDAAKILGVTRQTINSWCQKSELPDKILHKVNFLVEHIKSGNYQKISEINNGVIVSESTTGNIDARQYYADSPDVLRAQIDLLDERIKEKDAQIKEKDAQISRLMGIIEKMGDK